MGLEAPKAAGLKPLNHVPEPLRSTKSFRQDFLEELERINSAGIPTRRLVPNRVFA